VCAGTAFGQTTISSTQALDLEGGTTTNYSGGLLNNGTIYTGLSSDGNGVAVSGTFTNNGSYVMYGTGDTTTVSGALINNGVFSVFGTNDVVNVLSLSGTGSVTLLAGSGATLNLTGGGLGITDIAAGASWDVGGAVNVINGGSSTNALANLTSIEGSLTLENGLTTTITPGGTPATLTLAMGSSMDLDAGSTLNINGNVMNNGMFTTGWNGGSNDSLTISGTFTNNGMFMTNGAGDVVTLGSLNNMAGAMVTIGAGTTMFLGTGITDVAAGSSLDVAGNLYLTGGTTSGLAQLTSVEGFLTLENGGATQVTPMGGPLTIGSMGAIIVSDSVGTSSPTSLNVNGAISNAGSVAVMGTGNSLNLTGNFNNTGSVVVGQGNTLSAGGTFHQSGSASSTDVAGTLTAGSFTQSGGATTVESGGNLSATSVHISGGTLQGTGTITGNLSLTGGTLLPGAPGIPGTLSLSGNFIQGPGGTLVIDIGDAPAGQTNSVFSVSGIAHLGGTVDFTLDPGFTPTIGDEFTFLTFGSSAGNFADIVLTGWSCPVGAVCEDVFGSGTLTLEILPAPPTSTPEPGSLLLLGSGLAACCGYLRKRKSVHSR